MAHFWEAAVPTREPVQQRTFLPLVLVAVVLSVPFYWTEPSQWLGMPAWVWACVACSAVISAATGLAALRGWHDDAETPHDTGGASDRKEP